MDVPEANNHPRWPRRARAIAVAAGFLAAACWPLRDALMSGNAAGAGPDVAVTMWGMWWFSVEWVGAAWRGASTLANFPNGVVGGVLAPVTSSLWALFHSMLGPAWATTLTGVATLTGWCGVVAWLGRRAGLSPGAACLAGLLALEGRYLVYAVGETSVVGITALPALVAVGALFEWAANPRRRWLVLYVVGTVLGGAEFPYLAALPTIMGILLVVHRRDKYLAFPVALAVGLALLSIAAAGRGQVHDFGSLSRGMTVTVGQWQWPRAEHEFARATPLGLLVPGPVVWSLDGASTPFAKGREYLGLPLVLAAVFGAWRQPTRAAPFLVVAAVGVAFSTGSEWFGLPSPFALTNALTAKVVRLLTQPTRFLTMAAVALPIAAAFAVDWLNGKRPWGWLLGSVLVADAFCFGGLSLRLPTTELPAAACVSALSGHPRGAVVTWPWDGLDGGEASVQTRIWQVVHQQPSPGRGVGSWTLLGKERGDDMLAALGLEAAVFGEGAVDPASLHRLGYRWVVADLRAGDWVLATARASLGEPAATCEGAAVFTLAPDSATPSPYVSIAQPPAGWHQRDRRSLRPKF